MIYLSHFLDNSTPKYAGNERDLNISKASCMCAGDSSNSLFIQMKNHVGTHIDLPRHFDNTGSVLNDYHPKDWFYSKPQILDIKVEAGTLIQISHIKKKIKSCTDFLVIRTGFEALRSSESYWNNNPGVGEGVGSWLRENFPNLKAIGFDFISLSSYKHRPIGRIAHKEFLSKEYQGNPILIIEDMKLAELKFTPKEIIVIPLLINNADGSPVTVIAIPQ